MRVGPTSAAIVVSSSKGTILPTTMANLAVDNGYRTAGNGTAWAYYPFVADYFGFNDYANTSSLDTAISYLNKGYFVVTSVGSGLFTTGGHYIVLVGIDGDTIQIYDPYLYNGKFNTASRRGKVTVSGNTVYCSIENFRNYANYRGFFAYQHSGNVQENTGNVTTSTYTRYVATNSKNLNVRSGAGTGYRVIGSLRKGTAVTVAETNGSWSKITSPMNGWVSNSYLSSSPVSSETTTITGYTTGKYRVTNVSRSSVLCVRTGAGTGYSRKTYNQLTSNARSQNRANGNYYANGYKNGVVFTVSRVNGNWGLTPSGWVHLGYCTKIQGRL